MAVKATTVYGESMLLLRSNWWEIAIIPPNIPMNNRKPIKYMIALRWLLFLDMPDTKIAILDYAKLQFFRRSMSIFLLNKR